jgi:hypothetical protein
VDSAHTNANARPKTATRALRDLSKQLRREIYREMVELSGKFPDKPCEAAELADEIEYAYRLLENVGTDILQSEKPSLIELYECIKELPDTDRTRKIRSKDDEDARFGHKTASSTFFGFKNHLAMTEDRIITGIEVTHGGESDCKQPPALLEKTIENGVEVKETIGGMAYVSEDNLDVCAEKGVTLYARTNPAAAAAAAAKLDEGFCFNKDAGLLQCPAGGGGWPRGRRKERQRMGIHI